LACHFWEEIAPPAAVLQTGAVNERLVQLQAAFRADAGHDTTTVGQEAEIDSINGY